MAATCRRLLITLLMPLQTCSCCPLYVVKAYVYLFAVFEHIDAVAFARLAHRLRFPFFVTIFFFFLGLVASWLQRRYVWDIAVLLLPWLPAGALAQRSMYLQARYCMLIQINQQPNQCHQTWWKSRKKKKPAPMLFKPQAVLRSAVALIATFA